jgi:hypothetical protein
LPSNYSQMSGNNPDTYFLDQDNLKYSVRYSPEDECWRCSCPWIYWTGLPCAHVVKMLGVYGGELSYYIS